MAKDPEEWLKQAEYDMDTARAVFGAGRYIHVVFMCHLSIEKTLKGLYLKKLKEEPPKIHNLLYLMEKVEMKPPGELEKFLLELNGRSVPTRYPEDPKRMIRDYNKKRTADLMEKSVRLPRRIKKQY
ncbi:MAG: HEPN domain-containing protein [bacterium]